MKKVFYSILFLLFVLPLGVFAIIPRSEDYYVTDGANILKKDTYNYIKECSNYLHKVELIDYYLVTIDDLGDLTMEEYSDQIFEEYPIDDNGLLVLISRGNGLLRIQIGSDLGEFISEDTISEYIDEYFTPYIEAGDWDTGIRNGYNSFYKLICDHYKMDTSSIQLLHGVDYKTKYADYIIFGIAFLLMFFAFFYLKMYRNIFIKRSYHDGILDYLLVAVVLIINVGLLIYVYTLKPLSSLVVLIVEGTCIYSFYVNHFDLMDFSSIRKMCDKNIKNYQEQKKIEDEKLEQEKINRLKEILRLRLYKQKQKRKKKEMLEEKNKEINNNPIKEDSPRTNGSYDTIEKLYFEQKSSIPRDDYDYNLNDSRKKVLSHREKDDLI